MSVIRHCAKGRDKAKVMTGGTAASRILLQIMRFSITLRH